MHFSSVFSTVFAALLLGSVQAGVVKRSTVEPIIPFSTVVAPVAGTAIAAGDTFDLSYPVSVYGRCPSSLYALSLYLLDHEPTDADVNPTQPGGNMLLNPLYQWGQSWLGWTEPGKCSV